jgi:hypothetical protein
MTKTTTLMTSPRDFAQRHWPAIGLAALLVVLAVACYSGALPRLTATSTTSATPAAAAPAYVRICVAGVSYIQLTSGASVEWTPASKVKTCAEAGK